MTTTVFILISPPGFGSSPFLSPDGINQFPFNPELLPDAHTASLLLGRKRKVTTARSGNNSVFNVDYDSNIS
jgi:hypothetical protein